MIEKLKKKFSPEKASVPSMSYELVANTAFCINAITPTQISLELVIMFLDAQGFTINNQEVGKHFNCWKQSKEGDATCDTKDVILNDVHFTRKVFEHSAKTAEESYRKMVDRILKRERFEYDAYENYESIHVSDPDTELRVFRWYQRIYPLIIQMIMKSWYAENRDNPQEIGKLMLAYRPENYPMDK